MCGRYANHVKQMGQWADLLGDWPADANIGYNIAPTAMVPAFTAETGRAMHWGMIPPWAKEPKVKYATFNARSESVAEKPAFRHAWNKSQTCLVPALGYYEWKGPKGNKQPWFIRPEADEPLVMAGLWEHWPIGGIRPLLLHHHHPALRRQAGGPAFPHAADDESYTGGTMAE